MWASPAVPWHMSKAESVCTWPLPSRRDSPPDQRQYPGSTQCIMGTRASTAKEKTERTGGERLRDSVGERENPNQSWIFDWILSNAYISNLF